MDKDIGNKQFLNLLDEVARVHRAKAAGYSGSDNPDTWANFREAEAWGLTPLQGCLVRMGDKYRRIQNLRRNAANEQVGESIRDTLMDLANYALIAVCLLQEENDERRRQESLLGLSQVKDFWKGTSNKGTGTYPYAGIHTIHHKHASSHNSDEPCHAKSSDRTTFCWNDSWPPRAASVFVADGTERG